MSVHEMFHYHSAEELGRRMRELGLDLELSDDFSRLLAQESK